MVRLGRILVAIVLILSFALPGCSPEREPDPDPREAFVSEAASVFAETSTHIGIVLADIEHAVELADLEEPYSATAGKLANFAGELQTLGDDSGVDAEMLADLVDDFMQRADLFGDAAASMAQEDLSALRESMQTTHASWLGFDDPAMEEVPGVYEATQDLVSAFGRLKGSSSILAAPVPILDNLDAIREFYFEHTHLELQQEADTFVQAVGDMELVELFGLDDPNLISILDNLVEVLDEPKVQEWVGIPDEDLPSWLHAAAQEAFIEQSIALGEAFSSLGVAMGDNVSAYLAAMEAQCKPAVPEDMRNVSSFFEAMQTQGNPLVSGAIRNVTVEVTVTPSTDINPDDLRSKETVIGKLTRLPEDPLGIGPAVADAASGLIRILEGRWFAAWLKVSWEEYGEGRCYLFLKCDQWNEDEAEWQIVPAPSGEGPYPNTWWGPASSLLDKYQLEQAIYEATENKLEQLGIYDLTSGSTAGGCVTSPGEGSFTYRQGTVVGLVAEAEDGYEFVNWTGDVGTVGNVNTASTTITMEGNHSITANFEEEGEERSVHFPDPNLEAAIREAIGKATGDIYASDLQRLTHLDARERGIADLTGLEYCTNLTHLYLLQNEISDVSPLSNLVSLRVLWLDHNQIADVSALANLTGLTSLQIGFNQIIDISPLANLTNLVSLGPCCNQISDISPLAGLTNLTSLSLGENQVSDISPLAGLTNLSELGLDDNKISDISPLAGLTSLTRLYLWDNQISDIKPLVDNPGLGEGDIVALWDNPLSTASRNTHIPALRARGVDVGY